MGFMKSLFGKSSNESGKKETVPWIPLDDIAQLDVIKQKSLEKPQLIFKHSTTCGISRMVLNMFTSKYDFDDQLDAHFLDLHSYRNISNEVAATFGVVHQSPQLLVIKNGEVAYHTSHGAIIDVDLNNFL